MTLQPKKFSIPNKRNKQFMRETKGFDAVAHVMARYLDKWEVKGGKELAFAERYWELMIEKVKSGEVRLILPHNLGYMQVLAHQYAGKAKEHLLKFGNVDYSFIWMRHPMFLHHRINASKSLNESIREMKLRGTNYLTEYVDGDTYAA